MMWVQPFPPWQVAIYSKLLQVRPNQVAALIKRLLLIRRQVVMIRSGQRFLIDPVSIFGLSLINEGMYESRLTALVEQILRPGDVFVDVGGNEGYFSVIAADRVGNGQVYCVEPQSRLLPIIAANTQLNNIHNIIIEHTALADQQGTAALFLRPSTNTGASSLFRHWRFGSKVERVAQTTLDSLVERRAMKQIRLIKCDCEGAEYLVVRGSLATLREQRIDFIAMEYHPSICGMQGCVDSDSALRSAGYTLACVNGKYLYYRPGVEHELVGLGQVSYHNEWPA